ncbi:MAG TPA: type II toxin-antitoxin system MqsA family antitoxin [Polyangiaceae bacterium]|nr:type II toxin-antitoxin system MqsA family antitoxin [Polyangiaceae bacterium]
MKNKTQSCPECGGRMKLGSKVRVLKYRELQDKVRVTGWWCDSCGEGILTGEDLQKYSRALQNLKAKAEEVLPPAKVAEIRERLGLSQRQAGELLGGGPRAFQKYEAGSQTPSVPMSHLLKLLARDPSRLKELGGVPKRTLRSTKAAPSTRSRSRSKTALG